MQNEPRPPIYALTKEHDSIVLAIYTSASVSLPPVVSEIEEMNETSSVRNVKALWDTGATHVAISDRLATEMRIPSEDFYVLERIVLHATKKTKLSHSQKKSITLVAEKWDSRKY